jgi:hypothetical protein
MAARTAKARDDQLDQSADVHDEPSPDDSRHNLPVGEALVYRDYTNALRRLREWQAATNARGQSVTIIRSYPRPHPQLDGTERLQACG